MAEAYIVAAVRTAGGKKNGRLSKTHPADMGGKVIDALIERTGVPADKVDDVIYGCVSQIGPQTLTWLAPPSSVPACRNPCRACLSIASAVSSPSKPFTLRPRRS